MRFRREWIPNALSISRIPLGLAFLLLFDSTNLRLFVSAVGIAGVAFATDVLDGRLARRWGVASDAGGLIDGIGDKAFYVAVYLVLAEEHEAESVLIWGLIFREIALYALRTIDSKRQVNTKQLRWASLTYAFVIRMYFLSFFVKAGCTAIRTVPPVFLDYGYVFGYTALLLGYIGLAKLVQLMAE